jgi:hypothetical protein
MTVVGLVYVINKLALCQNFYSQFVHRVIILRSLQSLNSSD